MLPLAEIDTLFLDAGNTLVSMDFDWVARELSDLGVSADAEAVRRAEAAARPSVSSLAERMSSRNESLFEPAMRLLLAGLDGARSLGESSTADVVAELARRIKRPGEDYRLWSWMMPGVDRVLPALGRLGLKLVVVSNSDGSIERVMRELGLRDCFANVFDSHVVGFEKPDRRFFEHALAESGSDAARTAHVGDMYYHDVMGARGAGLHSVLLDPFDDWDVDDCLRCRDLGHLEQLLAAARR